MSTQAPDRIVELWPLLPEAARKTLVDIAEASAPREAALALTFDEERAIDQAREDFAAGRTLDHDAYRAEMDRFISRLSSQGS